MKIEWKNIDNNQAEIVSSWLSSRDKHNLCMKQKGWEQTAMDIGSCLNHMEGAQFKNIIGYINHKPVVAVMFGVEQIGVLNLYNIIVNPSFRNLGVAKNVIEKMLNNDKALKLTKSYQKVVISTLEDNKHMHQVLKSLGFENLGFDGEYIVFEKPVNRSSEIVM